MFLEVFPFWLTWPSVCRCWPVQCSAFCTMAQRRQKRRKPATTCSALSFYRGIAAEPSHLCTLLHFLQLMYCFFRCQWQVEANGAISPALTPSPSPLPLTIEEDREFTYPADMLIPPPGLIPGSYFDLPRIRLPPGIMGRLREVSGRARPQFRPSIK